MTQWQKVKVGDFLFERKEKYQPNDEKIAGLGRINKIDFSGNFHIAQKPSNTKMILICPDDLVISGINVAKGAMGVYRGDKNIKATIHYSSYTFDEGKINVDYFKRFLKSAEFVKLLQEQVKGGIKTEIKPKHILPLEINLPSIKEQKIIVKKLKDIETEESDLKQEITQQQILLKKLRQQILQEAIEGKLTQDWRVKNPNTEPASELLKRIQAEKQQLIKDKKIKAQKPLSVITEDEKLFKLPKSWVWCQVNDIANIGTGATPLTSEPSYYGGEFNWMTSGDTGYDYVTHTKLTISKKAIQETNCKIYPTKTLVVAMYGQGKTRGQVTELKIDTATNQACVAIQIYIFSVEANQFLKTHFKKIYNEIRKLAQGGAQPNLNMGKIKANVVALPPLLEQKAIVAKVEKLLSICDKLQTQITANQTHAEQLMQAVLKEAFTQSEQPIKLTV
ncbi:Type I restriction-modification system, specificity subunit S [uncultured Gammaproteobacteria bacterium]|jgi:type I restriction enzyme S subunit|nr:Type I restriction-modification system, specificity subunit S [uncultured Gammaproteobacteria bacterium]